MDFNTIQRKLRDQSEQYRERHLSLKLSLYAGFFAYEGLTVAAAAIISGRSTVIATAIIAMALVSAAILFLHYHWFLRMYDALGYTKISIKSEEDIDRYYTTNERIFKEFRTRKRLRRFLDVMLYVLAFVQMALLTCGIQCTI